VLSRADAVCGEIYRLPGGVATNGTAAPRGGVGGGAHGALQRSATEAQPLSDMALDSDVGSLPSGGSEGGEGDDEDAAILDAVLTDTAAPDAADRRTSGAGGPGAAPSSPAPPRRESAAGEKRKARRSSVTSSDVGVSADGSRAGAAAGDLAGADGSEGATYHRNHGVRVPGVAVARIEGSWLSHLNVDSKRYWTLAESKPKPWLPPSAGRVLPSDASSRRDLRTLKTGDFEAAQRVKEEMEVEQRADRKLREAAGVYEHH
jgi:hypothetical protein